MNKIFPHNMIANNRNYSVPPIDVTTHTHRGAE